MKELKTMANEINSPSHRENGQCKGIQSKKNTGVEGPLQHHVKGYRKKGLVSDAVLVERLSDVSLEDNTSSPAITLSSVEFDYDDVPSMNTDDKPEETGEERRANFSNKNPLKSSLSLDVPALNINEEAKRPPIE